MKKLSLVIGILLAALTAGAAGIYYYPYEKECRIQYAVGSVPCSASFSITPHIQAQGHERDPWKELQRDLEHPRR